LDPAYAGKGEGKETAYAGKGEGEETAYAGKGGGKETEGVQSTSASEASSFTTVNPFRWLGDGNLALSEQFKQNVEVAGWLNPAQMRTALEGAKVYLHTALWEGFPVSILDASAVGLPILARRPQQAPVLGSEPRGTYLDGMPSRWQFETAAEGAQLVIELLSSAAKRIDCARDWQEALAGSTTTHLAETLEELYAPAANHPDDKHSESVKSSSKQRQKSPSEGGPL
jgi:glycosyltransferase involved in cell wall biosynthesis